MSKIKILTFFILTTLTACQTPPNPTSVTEVSDATKENIAKEIATLNDDQSQRSFLENISDLDQKVRHDQSDIENKFGLDSKESNEGRLNLMKTDNENLEKVEQFLTRYGHPTVKRHGEKAANAPWIVVHHSPKGVEVREKNFKYIYQAYKNGDIDDGALTFYMNRWYDIKFKQRIEWNRPYKIQEEIDTLVQSLDVQHIVEEIDDKF